MTNGELLLAWEEWKFRHCLFTSAEGAIERFLASLPSDGVPSSLPTDTTVPQRVVPRAAKDSSRGHAKAPGPGKNEKP